MEINKKVAIDISMVDDATEETRETFGMKCLGCGEFSKEKINILKKAIQLDFDIRNYPSLSFGCGAIQKNFLVIAGDKNIYKCWNNVGKKHESIGNIENGSKYNGHLYDWLAYSPFEDKECLDCNILPICMGKCPYHKVMKGIKSNCIDYKFNLVEALKLHKTSEVNNK